MSSLPFSDPDEDKPYMLSKEHSRANRFYRTRMNPQIYSSQEEDPEIDSEKRGRLVNGLRRAKNLGDQKAIEFYTHMLQLRDNPDQAILSEQNN